MCFSFHSPSAHPSGLIQKPTLMVPTLVEGQQSTLVCTAPGLCSGSGPNITWAWRGTGENTSHVTTQETETVSQFTKRHSSTLTLNSSAENHGDSVVCEVRFKNSIRAEEAATLNVTCECIVIVCSIIICTC